MTRRIFLALLAAGALCALPASASAASPPDLQVRALADPVPTGQAVSYGLRLTATVVNDGGRRARASELRFFLSQNARLGEADTPLPAVRTAALAPGEHDAAGEAWSVPRTLDAGIYHVIACADAGRDVAERDESDNCTVARETVAVTEPGGETADQAGAPMPGATASGAPKNEFFPETNTEIGFRGIRVSDPFDCPASAHGQGSGRCVWVQTPMIRYDWQNPDVGRVRSDFWYCPSEYRYPFEVALGFDPMWENLGFQSDTFVETVAAVKWTLYKNWLGRQYYPSYGAPDGSRGYVTIDFNGVAFEHKPWTHEARFLCSSKLANSMLP
jgi:hypothetical protein